MSERKTKTRLAAKGKPPRLLLTRLRTKVESRAVTARRMPLHNRRRVFRIV
jgi:hypothetical protein